MSEIDGDGPRLVLAAGSTATARIDGISAAGAEPALLAHTPAADAELLTRGHVVEAPAVPASPTGCPTPVLVTRAARDVLGFETSVLDAGLAAPCGAPAVDVGAEQGADVREPVAVPVADEIARQASAWVSEVVSQWASDATSEWPSETASESTAERSLDRIAVAETIPGGTTTALGLLRALGERPTVSSSLPENPIERKQSVVADGLDASGLTPGDCAGEPLRAVRTMGDPVQATVLGVLDGALGAGIDVDLWGGTQMLAVVAAARHADHLEWSAAERSAGSLRVVTTSYVAEDDSAAVQELAADLDVPLATIDPGFERCDHVGLRQYAAGEAKEGVGMGGALALAAAHGKLDAVRDRFRTLYGALVAEQPAHGGSDRGS